MNRWTVLILCGVGLGGLVLFLALRYPDALIHRGDQVQLTHALLFAGVIGASAILHGRFRAREAVRNALAWVMIGAVVLAGYSYRHEFQDLGQRMLGELIPHGGQSQSDGGVSFTRSEGGHFVVEAEVNGRPIRFLVDTGASDVTLSPADAERLGFQPSDLQFTRTYQTANGTVLGAPVRLDEIRVGSIAVRDVRGSVNGAPMRRSLLGMSFLNRLSRFEISRDRLTIYP